MVARIAVLVVVSVLLKPIETTKWLRENPGFDSPAAWTSELPCSLEEVVFPKDFSALLPLPAFVDIAGFILPSDGALLLSADSSIQLGGGGQPGGRSCENGNARKAYIRKPTLRKWFDPNSWRNKQSMGRNSAVPHMERVPCNNDSVIIQDKGALALDLEGEQYLRLGQLNLAGSLLSRDYLLNLISTEIGRILFKHSSGVSVEYYRHEQCGCHKDAADFIEPICHNVVESCARPHCLVPVLPYESCCAICGAVLQFPMMQCRDAPLHKLRKVIATALDKEELNDRIDYYVNYIDMGRSEKIILQAIIVDREEYAERSVNFASRLNASTDWTKLFAAPQRLDIQFSGRPYNPNITFGSVLLIMLCLLLMTIVGLVMFAHYAPESRHLRRVPRYLYDTRRWRELLMRSPFVFARFDNTVSSTDGAVASGVASQNIIMGYDAGSEEVRERRAFDNPMFGEVLMTTKAIEDEEIPGADANDKAASISHKLDYGNLANALEGGSEEQELTKIKLGSSDSDDDVEQETAK